MELKIEHHPDCFLKLSLPDTYCTCGAERLSRRTLQQVVAWGHGQCTEHGVPVMRRSCMLCWQELKELANET